MELSAGVNVIKSQPKNMHKNNFYKLIANVFWMYNLSNLLWISWACFYFNEGFSYTNVALNTFV